MGFGESGGERTVVKEKRCDGGGRRGAQEIDVGGVTASEDKSCQG